MEDPKTQKTISATRSVVRREILARSARAAHRDSFVDVDREQLRKIADELAKGESALNSAPQVIVKKINGEVQCIIYTAGNLDVGNDASENFDQDVNALITTSLIERKALALKPR